MAKTIKFPLTMKDDVQVRDLDELREHFDLDKVIEYFIDGKLLTWLEARYYDAEADEVRALDKNNIEFCKKLCEIFDVKYDKEETAASNLEEIAERNRKLSMLRQYTSDPAILEKVDSVAFDQEDLADLLDNDVHDIYLCNNSFSIPLRVEDKKYIGIGKAEAVIKSKEYINFAEKQIVFENVRFDSIYENVYRDSPEGLHELGRNAEYAEDYSLAVEYYRKAADKGNTDSMVDLGSIYSDGKNGVEKDVQKAIYWYTEAANLGAAPAMDALAWMYGYGSDVEKDDGKAHYWLEKAANNGFTLSMLTLGQRYRDGIWGCEQNLTFAVQWFVRAANEGMAEAMQCMGDLYSGYRSMGSLYDMLHYAGYKNPSSYSLPRDAVTARLWYEKALKIFLRFKWVC